MENKWKPSFLKKNERFKDVPDYKSSFLFNEESIFKKETKYECTVKQFPTLGDTIKDNKNIQNNKNDILLKKNTLLEKKSTYNDNEFPVLVGSLKDNKTEKKSKSSNWINIINKEAPKNDKVINNDTQEYICNENQWTEQDSLEEYFDVMNSDIMLDINDNITSYCNEKYLPFYDIYDKYSNLVDFIKQNSTKYSKLFDKTQTLSDSEENNEDELNETI
jgi:hypothetical protein